MAEFAHHPFVVRKGEVKRRGGDRGVHSFALCSCIADFHMVEGSKVPSDVCCSYTCSRKRRIRVLGITGCESSPIIVLNRYLMEGKREEKIEKQTSLKLFFENSYICKYINTWARWITSETSNLIKTSPHILCLW